MRSSKLVFWAQLTGLYCAVTLLLCLPVILNINNNTAAQEISTEKTQVVSAPTAHIGAPVTLLLEDLGIQAPIEEGKFIPSERTWRTVPDAVGWIRYASEYKNNTLHTDTILYGHNSESLLSKTADIQPDTKLLIKTSNNFFLTYEFKSSTVVIPEDASVLKTAKPATLTLITCTGENNSLRKLMEFSFKKLRYGY